MIGPRAGSCGTAMYTRQAVVVTDMLTDPLWADYRDLAKISGLRSCWSTPILSSLCPRTRAANDSADFSS